MFVLPVLDLQSGVVVRGVSGQRDQYRPIESRLCRDPSPRAVAQGLVDAFGFQQAYIADLDAIAGGEPSWETYSLLSNVTSNHKGAQPPVGNALRGVPCAPVDEPLALTERHRGRSLQTPAASERVQSPGGCGLRLWVDAGINDLARAKSLAEFQASGAPLAAIIAGLESLPSFGLLSDLVEVVGSERLVFSLDLKAGQPLASAPELASLDAETIAERTYEIGVRRMIVLDLARVGVGQGVGTEHLCRRLHERFPNLQLISGGGVRGPADLESLAAAGCHAALVASALHDGRLTRDDVACLWHA